MSDGRWITIRRAEDGLAFFDDQGQHFAGPLSEQDAAELRGVIARTYAELAERPDCFQVPESFSYKLSA